MNTKGNKGKSGKGKSLRSERRVDAVNGKQSAKQPEQNFTRVKSASAESHSATFQLYKNVGLNQKKVYLGNDALAKLAVIFESQHGVPMDVARIDPILLGDVLSYCINFRYGLQNNLSKNSPPVINPAETPAGQLLYRYYQMAHSHTYVDELVDAFNSSNKRGKRFFPHIDDVVDDFKLCQPVEQDALFNLEDADESNGGEKYWSTREIQSLRDPEEISDYIASWNGDIYEQEIDVDDGIMDDDENEFEKNRRIILSVLSSDDEDDDWPEGSPNDFN